MELAQFTLPEEHVVREIHGERRQLVPKTRDCRELWLPHRPVLRFGHGLDPEAAMDPGTSVRFSVTLAAAGRGLVTQIYSDTMVAGEGEPWRDVKLQLPEWGEQRVTLCLHAEADDPGGAVDGVLWENPAARSAVRAALHSRWRKTRMTEQEKSLAQRQLEAIGYVQ